MIGSRKSIFAGGIGYCGLFAVLVGAVVGLFAVNAQAMPNLARQYEADCTMCHSIIPRLNRTGYEFRRAGFRNPDEIGSTRDVDSHREDNTVNVGEYFSARLQMNASFDSKDDGVSSSNDNSTKIYFKEFTLYPLTGAFLGNWASMSEISGGTDELEVENAYLRYVWGDAGTYFEVRGGIFHPFEGFGASDRPLSISRPLIQKMGTYNANGDPNGWHPWGYDQSGIEAGFSSGNTSVTFTAFNGLIENAEDPAQGGKLRKDPGSPTFNDMDFQVFANQFIGDTDAAVSGYYYNGRISLGDPLVQNDFQRWAGYVTIPQGTFRLLGAFSGGSDTYTLGDTDINNQGFFIEIDDYVSETMGIGARYDSFDPNTDLDNDLTSGFTAFVNTPQNNGIQFITELKYTKTEHGSDPDTKDTSVNVRAIYIF